MDDDSIAAMCAAHGAAVSAGSFPAGTIFGDWRLTAFIGRGGNGEVYCAEHITLGTPAAVKVLVREEERSKARFAQEAKLLSELKSTSFPRFFAYREANGRACLAMELLEPGELPTGDKAVARFMLHVCDGVAELHARGVVHRDIKPGNILWRKNAPVLADLGLAKSVSAPLKLHDEALTIVDGRRAGVGTPGYGAPEQMERGEASAASDIHALGVLADRCFDGKPPRTWARIIRRATSSIPAHRYPSVAAFARAIRWRHLLRHAIGLTGILLALAAMSMFYPVGTRHDDAPVATVGRPENIMPQAPEKAKRTVGLSSPRTAESSPSVPDVVRLNGEKVTWAKPVVLESGKEYRISGPGTLDADLFCPAKAIVRLKNCVLINRTKRLYPENGIEYRLDDGVYLNFINIKKEPLSLTLGDFLGNYDGAYNQVRFGGPETVKELMEQISEEQFTEFRNMTP